jgi:hypothetical protein
MQKVSEGQSACANDISLPGNTYSIYGQPKLPEINMYGHFLAWLSFFERSLSHELEPTNCIFPYMGVNGVLYPKK